MRMKGNIFLPSSDLGFCYYRNMATDVNWRRFETIFHFLLEGGVGGVEDLYIVLNMTAAVKIGKTRWRGTKI